MMVFLVILLSIAISTTGVMLYITTANRNLIRGWTYTSEPDGHFYSSTITDPDGTEWGYEQQSNRVKKPYPVEELPRNYSSYRTNNKVWSVHKPKDTKAYVVLCAREDRKRKALAAREKVEKQF